MPWLDKYEKGFHIYIVICLDDYTQLLFDHISNTDSLFGRKSQKN